MRVHGGTDGNEVAPIQVEPTLNHWQTIQAGRCSRIQQGYQWHRGRGIGNQQAEHHNKIYEFLGGGHGGTAPHRLMKDRYTGMWGGGRVNGVKPFGAQEELITSVSNLRGLQSGGFNLILTNTELKRYEYRRNTEALLRKTFGAVRAKFSISAETVEDTNFKPGGTVTVVLGKWANLVI
jgi:hypothetical protein